MAPTLLEVALPGDTNLTHLKTEVQDTVSAYDNNASQLAQRRAEISAARARARRSRIRVPEGDDTHDYDDGGQEVATVIRYRLRQDAGMPPIWLPVREVLYQWEIPDLATALYLTDTCRLTRQRPSIVMTKDMREVLPWTHPSITSSTAHIIRGLQSMRFALHNT